MAFNSYIFIFLFLPLTLICYFLLNRFKNQSIGKAFLCLASLVFYGYFNWVYVPILLASMLINYGISLTFFSKDGRQSGRRNSRKVFLWLAIALNVGTLLVFKYYDFFVENINSLFGASFVLQHLILPLGISFYTFQQISYIVDSYRGEIQSASFLDYSVFITFFPKITSGPLAQFNNLTQQFNDEDKRHFDWENFSKGLMLFSLGMGKKVLIANSLGIIVDTGFSDISSLGAVNAVVVMLCYTLRIYFDFSGYTDMACGIGIMFNICMPHNFNLPYRAESIIDFWRRWHITLTQFLTKYIYFPLGGSRCGKIRTYINIMIVFLISGIWHGANWTFIVWGLLHGIANVITRACKEFKVLPKVLRWGLTFLFINLTWVIFRADSLADAVSFFGQFFKAGNGLLIKELASANYVEFISNGVQHIVDSDLAGMVIAIVVLGAFMIAALRKRSAAMIVDSGSFSKLSAVICSVILLASIYSFSGVSTFLYWSF